MSKLNLSPFARYRLSVTSRVLAAVIGGYALTSALTVLLALISPIDPPKMAAQLVSFPLYLCLLLWIFHAKSVARTWGWLVLWTLVAVALCWWKLKGGAS
ncbi:MAG: iron transporter [Zoogloeaceae bacterium]|nr:iron transporter [Zoogloeaceae bacterium]